MWLRDFQLGNSQKLRDQVSNSFDNRDGFLYCDLVLFVQIPGLRPSGLDSPEQTDKTGVPRHSGALALNDHHARCCPLGQVFQSQGLQLT